MSCNTCAKGFSFLRQEKGCPGCGFSFCSKCLNNKVFLLKLNSEAKVCSKCKKSSKEDDKKQIITPPDAYYKRVAAAEKKSAGNSSTSTTNNEDFHIDDQIQARLKKIKENNVVRVTSEEEIAKRLQGIKGVSSTSDAEISERLAKLRGMPIIENKPVLPVIDLRTEQEQANDLIKQYVEQTQIDTKYQDEFDSLISDIEGRVVRLKGTPSATDAGLSTTSTKDMNTPSQHAESDDEEESVKKIVEKMKAEALMEGNEITGTHNELPFCEICNEDATRRCLGCKYLFCKRCYKDHMDDDDGCNRFEPYQAPKGSEY